MPPQHDPSTVRPTEWLRAGLWLILVTGSYQAYSQIDVAIVGALRSKEEAGIYAAASRLSVLVQYGLIALQTIVAPRISAAYVARQMQDLQHLLSHLARLATMFAVAVSLIMIALAVPILGLFGEKFIDGSTILRVLVLAHVANAMTGATGFLLTMTGHQRHVAAVVTVMLVVTTTALLLVVQRYGSVGAAWVMVASTAVTHIVLAWMGWRLLGLRSWGELSLRGMRRNP
jgi:O-antigen/teichoic acid export membrane protein